MKKGQTYKLDPTKGQESVFWQFAGASRWVYNEALQRCQDYYHQNGKHLSPFHFTSLLTQLKREPDTSWLATIHSQVLQQPLRNLHTAYKNFFEGRADLPTRKKKYRHDAFRYPQGVRIVENRVYLPSIGWVKFFRSRNHIEGTIKSATVRRKASGWYVSITLEYEKKVLKPPVPVRESSIGIDPGLRHFCTTSDGDVYDMPRYYKEMEGMLRQLKKGLSRKVKGSNRWVKQLRKIQVLEERIARYRRDYQDQLSSYLVDRYDLICIENPNMSAMRQSLRLGKPVNDRAIAQFIAMLKYKCDEREVIFWQADRWWPSSKKCSECGEINHNLKLGDEVFECPNCHLTIDRDLNAALNFVAAGLAETLKRMLRGSKSSSVPTVKKHPSVKRVPELRFIPAYAWCTA